MRAACHVRTSRAASPFVLGLFTESTGTGIDGTGRFDPVLQISTTKNGTPACAEEFAYSKTLGQFPSPGESEMMYVSDQLPPSPEVLTGGLRPLALGLMVDSQPALGGRGAESLSSDFEPAWW